MHQKERTFHEVALEYASRKNPEWCDLSARSRQIYMSGIELLRRFFGLNVREITRPMVIELKDDLYSSRGNCRIALSVLSNILRYAHDRGYVDFNQAIRLRGLPKQKTIARWTEKEVETFLSTSAPKMKIAAALAYYTGQRRSDLVKMKWADYDGEVIELCQQKTASYLVIPVHPRLRKLLDEQPVESPFILTNAYGQPLTAETLQKAMRREGKRLGIDKSIHGLRKSAAAALAEMGCTVHQIQAITGHKSLKEIQRYTAEADQRRLAREAMKTWKSKS